MRLTCYHGASGIGDAVTALYAVQGAHGKKSAGIVMVVINSVARCNRSVRGTCLINCNKRS